MQLSRIFVSSSGDLRHVRKDLSHHLVAWAYRNGLSDVVEPYLWEDATSNGQSLLHRLSIQEQLLTTFDPSVALTIALFGERCGVPLYDACRTDGVIADRWFDGKFRLRHPWPTTLAESESLLNGGCFPLTGTVYELLSALSSGGEVLIGCILNKDVTFEAVADELIFNRATLLRAKCPLDQTSPSEMQRFRKSEYDPQVIALLNLLKALKEKGVTFDRFSSQEDVSGSFAAKAKRLLADRLQVGGAANPYKSTLDYYDVDDLADLPGRDRQGREAAQIFDGDLCAGRSPFLQLTGRSGCGKSSFLRRGLLGQLVKNDHLHVVFRPSDLSTGGHPSPLHALWAAIQLSAPELKLRYPFGDSVADHASRAAEALDDALKATNRRFIFGIDQFEELLDWFNDLETPAEDQRRLKEVFRFVRLSMKTGRSGVIATLERQREELMDKFETDGGFGRAPRVIDLDLNEETVRRIIREPLARVHLTPADDLLNALVKAWREIGPEANASSLPLLGLWLADFFRRIEHLAPRRHGGLRDELEAAASSTLEIGLSRIDERSLNMSRIVERLAESAWRIGGGETDPKNPTRAEHLDFVLTPLVGLPMSGAHLTLQSATRRTGYSPYDGVIDAFGKKRLVVSIRGAVPEQVRLTHQAVIDRWPAAAQWLEKRRSLLLLEARLRAKAEIFHLEASTKSDDFSADEIDEAATILWARFASQGSVAQSHTSNLFLRYCLRVFQTSRTPLRPISETYAPCHIHIAALLGLTDLIGIYLALDPDAIEACSPTGRTALSYAAAGGSAPAVRLLLEKGASTAMNGDGWMPVARALYSGKDEAFNLLVERLARIDMPVIKNLSTLLHLAAWVGRADLVQRFLPVISPESLDENDWTPLHCAACSGHTAIATQLSGRDFTFAADKVGWTPLGLAASNGHWRTLFAMLQASGHDVGDWPRLLMKATSTISVLAIAAIHSHPGVVKRLIDRGNALADPTNDAHLTLAKGGTLLHLAVRMRANAGGHLDLDQEQRLAKLVRLLLEDGRIDPNATDADGKTAYDLAHDLDMVRAAIEEDPRFARDWSALPRDDLAVELRSSSTRSGLSIVRNLGVRVLEPIEKDLTGADLLVAGDNHQALVLLLTLPAAQTRIEDGQIARIARYVEDRKHANLGRILTGLLLETPERFPVGVVTLAARLLLWWGADAKADVPRLVDACKDPASGVLGLRRSLLHAIAESGRADLFEVSARRSAFLPRDDWGRRPSDLAPRPQRAAIVEIENRLFGEVAG